MKTYKNKKTGNIIETDCEISGKHWEKVKPKKSKKEVAKDMKQDNNDVKQDGDGGDE